MGERIEVWNVWTEPANELGATTKSEFNKRRFTAEPAPGSLTEARLRLADAAEAWAAKWLAPVACRDADEWDAMLDAAVKLAALRTARGEG